MKLHHPERTKTIHAGRKTGRAAAATPLGAAVRSSAGLTLIEVLVAIVVLAIGVWAAMRIFPSGFGAIDVTRQRAIADQLAQSEMDRLKLLADNGTMIDAIVATDTNGLLLTDYRGTSSLPAQADWFADLTTYPPAAPNWKHPLWQPDSVFWPRTVLGEHITVPPLVTTGAVPLSFVSFAPLTLLPGRTPVDPANPSSTLDLGLGALARVYYPDALTSVTAAPASGETGKYFLSGATIAVAPDYANRYFRLSYTWQSGANTYRTVAETQRASVTGQITPSHTPVPGTETVYQELTYVVTSSASTDPGTGNFSLDGTSSVTGKLVFSPSDVGKKLKVDYRVADWSILHQDVVLPANGIARLAVYPVKVGGYRNAPRQPGEQFLRDQADPAADPNSSARDLLGVRNSVVAVVIADTVKPDNLGRYYADLVPTDPNLFCLPVTGLADAPDRLKTSAGIPMADDDYRFGRILFPDPPGAADIQDGKTITVRIFYRAERDWAVQVQKASAAYSRSTANMPDESHFVWLNNQSDPNYYPQTLFFAPSEHGKVVTVSYYDTARRYVTGSLYTVSAPMPITTTPGVIPPGPSGLVSQITLDPPPDPNGAIIANGVSVTARTIWAGPGASEAPGGAAPKGRTISGRTEYLKEAWLQSHVTTFLTPRSE